VYCNAGSYSGSSSSVNIPAKTAAVVLRFTPLPEIEGHAAVWTDAIFAAMQLQTMPSEETKDIRTRFFEQQAILQAEEGRSLSRIVL
jgi:hypothetical protein